MRSALARHAGRLWCGVPLHAAAGAIGALAATVLGLGGAICPDGPAGVSIAAACVGIPVLPGALWRDLPNLAIRRWMPALGRRPGHV